MKKILFTLMLISSLVSLKAQVDTLNLDSFCIVNIGYETLGSGVQLTAYAFDFTNPNGGGGAFTYLWSTGDTTQSIPLLAGGTYCVTATSDGSGCEAATCITVDDQDCDIFPWLDFSGNLYAYHSGIPPYTYLWSTGDTTHFIPVNEGDTYCVTVTDAFGCAADTCTVVSYNGLDTLCIADIFVWPDSAGNIILTAYGGLNGLWPGQDDATYQWSTGDTTASIVATNISEYCVTVTVGICSAEACIDLSNYDCGLWIGCDPPGTFTAFAFGIPPYTYVWNTGDSTASIPVQAGETYCVTVTDALGCISDTCMVADSIIFPPNDTFCQVFIDYWVSDSGIVLTAYGFPIGSANLTYIWNTGETTQSINGIPGVEYCVTATSPNFNCTATACIQLDDLDCTDVYVLCDPDGTLGVLSAGLPPFTYLWSTGDTTEFIVGEVDSMYCVTITDALDCTVDTCVTLMGFPPDTFNFPSGIYGSVFGGDSTNVIDEYEGWVYLYQKDQQGNFNLLDSTEVMSDLFFSGYFFEEVDEGEYLTKAVVSSLVTGEDYIPTYHFSAMEWDEADIIDVTNTSPAGGIIYDAPIFLLGTSSLTGPGSISGIISDMDNILNDHDRGDNGIDGVTIILTDEFDQTLGYMITSENGEFSFDNLPYGTYHLHADFLNFSGPYAVVSISADNPDGAVSFEVEGEDILLHSNEVNFNSEVEVFPNPARDIINIAVSSDLNVRSLLITNLQGKTIEYLTDLSSTTIELSIRELSPGIHLIHLITDQGIANKKIMIIE